MGFATNEYGDQRQTSGKRTRKQENVRREGRDTSWTTTTTHKGAEDKTTECLYKKKAPRPNICELNYIPWFCMGDTPSACACFWTFPYASFSIVLTQIWASPSLLGSSRPDRRLASCSRRERDCRQEGKEQAQKCIIKFKLMKRQGAIDQNLFGSIREHLFSVWGIHEDLNIH